MKLDLIAHDYRKINVGSDVAKVPGYGAVQIKISGCILFINMYNICIFMVERLFKRKLTMRVKQIENLFSLMEYFIRAKQPLSMREIVDEFSWPRSSAFNIVSTLVELGYLYQPEPRGGFSPTSKWLDLAKDLAASQPLPEKVHELLSEIMLRTGETVILAAPDGVNAVFLDVVESNAVIKFTAQIGERSPIHITSMGRALLSQYTTSERMLILKKIKYETFAGTDFTSAKVVEDNIRKSKKNGWFVNVADEEGLAGLGVPFHYRNRCYAIAIGAPVSRIKKSINETGRLIRDLVAEFLEHED